MRLSVALLTWAYVALAMCILFGCLATEMIRRAILRRRARTRDVRMALGGPEKG